jgi:hypothetical protein
MMMLASDVKPWAEQRSVPPTQTRPRPALRFTVEGAVSKRFRICRSAPLFPVAGPGGGSAPFARRQVGRSLLGLLR